MAGHPSHEDIFACFMLSAVAVIELLSSFLHHEKGWPRVQCSAIHNLQEKLMPGIGWYAAGKVQSQRTCFFVLHVGHGDRELLHSCLGDHTGRLIHQGCSCTGMADPGPVAAALWTDAELGSSVCLDSIVTVVDARNIRGQLAESRPDGAINEAQQQIAYADVILLNKVIAPPRPPPPRAPTHTHTHKCVRRLAIKHTAFLRTLQS